MEFGKDRDVRNLYHGFILNHEQKNLINKLALKEFEKRKRDRRYPSQLVQEVYDTTSPYVNVWSH